MSRSALDFTSASSASERTLRGRATRWCAIVTTASAVLACGTDGAASAGAAGDANHAPWASGGGNWQGHMAGSGGGLGGESGPIGAGGIGYGSGASRDPGLYAEGSGGLAGAGRSPGVGLAGGTRGLGGGGGVPTAGSAGSAPGNRAGNTVAAGGNGRGGGGVRFVDGGGGNGASRDAGGFGNEGAGGRPQVKAGAGTTLVAVDSSVHYQTFEGWGASICWWGNRIGGWTADKRDRLIEAIVNPTTGLGYNVFRYNVGGGENPAHDHMGADREMPGFEPTRGTWDWDADARQRAVLTRLSTSSPDIIVEAFSNSPPHWMTKSGCASGSSDGSDNLKDDSYDLFADYLTEVVKHYRDVFGITFRTLEPLNEPNANWWKANGGQEGCHFSPANQQRIIKAVGAELDAKGLKETRVSASDENSLDDAYNNLSKFDAASLGYISQMNAHSYSGTRRANLRALATEKGKRLWQSESGPLNATLATEIDAAMFMAGRIIQDLREMQPNAWLDWQIVDPVASWTSFVVDDAKQSFTPNKRFYMHAGFSRYIRPGAVFIKIDNADMVAALDRDGASLAIVARNGDKSATRKFTLDLTRLPSIGPNVEVYRTSASENLQHLAPIPVSDWSFTAELPPYSITTYAVALQSR